MYANNFYIVSRTLHLRVWNKQKLLFLILIHFTVYVNFKTKNPSGSFSAKISLIFQIFKTFKHYLHISYFQAQPVLSSLTTNNNFLLANPRIPSTWQESMDLQKIFNIWSLSNTKFCVFVWCLGFVFCLAWAISKLHKKNQRNPYNPNTCVANLYLQSHCYCLLWRGWSFSMTLLYDHCSASLYEAYICITYLVSTNNMKGNMRCMFSWIFHAAGAVLCKAQTQLGFVSIGYATIYCHSRLGYAVLLLLSLQPKTKFVSQYNCVEP